jgi:hypothetical protein
MWNKKKSLPHKSRYHRPLLSDVLPYEVPPNFSNVGLFNFAKKHNIVILRKQGESFVKWECDSDKIDIAISLIFQTDQTKQIEQEVKFFSGKNRSYRTWKIANMWTIPYSFNIAHKEHDARTLSLIHPRNQIAVASFYNDNSARILDAASNNSFSIRYPAGLATTSFYEDRLHVANKGLSSDEIEEFEKEYDNLGTYFAYKKYSNIFKFYESYQAHNAEKKFSKLEKLDISKCFDNIYTHSMAWTTLGSQANKDCLALSQFTFGGRFDTLMQEMNQGETNGIVIGPEFSRIFAEIILQGIDKKLELCLSENYNLTRYSDYQIFRYVDDYFVYFNDPKTMTDIRQNLRELLRTVKLNINIAKTESFERPIITPQTIARMELRDFLASQLKLNYVEINDPHNMGEVVEHFIPKVSANSLIVGFKSILKRNQISYGDMLNYALGALENNIEKLFEAYGNEREVLRDQRLLTQALVELMEFCFFIYSASPKVNFTIRLCRIVAQTVDSLNSLRLDADNKRQVFKYVHDSAIRVVKSNAQEEFREIETLYLLLALKKLGRNYQLDELSLSAYFRFEWDGANFKSEKQLDYFSITVCLLYIKDQSRYAKLKAAIETKIVERFRLKGAYAKTDTELILLYLDIITCPYISSATKASISSYFDHSPANVTELAATNDYWFVNWRNFNLTVALDNKRARDVY